MKKLREILEDIDVSYEIQGDVESLVNEIFIDSRKVNSNDAFVAIKGSVLDGHDYIESAINKGAKVIFCEYLPANILSDISLSLIHISEPTRPY